MILKGILFLVCDFFFLFFFSFSVFPFFFPFFFFSFFFSENIFIK